MHAKSAHCLCGQSPIGQLESTNKFLNDHAINKAAKARLNRFAHKYGNAKNKAASPAKKVKNKPGLPKAVPVLCHPVMISL